MAGRRNLVLIANDDEAVRDALRFALRLEGLCVHAHNGAPTLLADPALTRAGCVVLDDRMPQMDGFALLADLRARDLDVPVILLAAHATTRLKKRAEAAGVRMVLEKPLLKNDLVDNIRMILALSGRAAQYTGDQIDT